MKFTPFKIGFLSIALLFSGITLLGQPKQASRSHEEAALLAAAEETSLRGNCHDDEDHCPPLRITNLCARHIKAKSLAAKKVCAHELHSDELSAGNAIVSEKLCAHELSSPKACLGDLTVQNICSNGQARFADLLQCSKYCATAAFSANTNYVLGSPVNFDTIIDDPNGNVSVGPFSYTAPVSGYYVSTIEIDQFNLAAPGGPVLGAPVSNIEIYVNGNLRRQNYSPYLTFSNKQLAILSSVGELSAGDVVTVKYNVLATSDAGFFPVIGTVDLIGAGGVASQTLFTIHLLSATCTDLPCGECNFQCESKQDICCPKLDCHPCKPSYK